MKLVGGVLLIIALTAGSGGLGAASAQDKPGPAGSPEALFKEGKFAEAEKIYSDSLRADPKNYATLVRLGFIALLSNRLDEAEKRLKSAMDLKPDESAPKSLLAEAYYRRDDFLRAAPFFRAAGDLAKADQLDSFKSGAPYQIEGPPGEASVAFVMTDPLPVVSVKVNGREAVNFFIDTGAGQVIVDTEYAKELGLAFFGSETGTFAGGKKAPYQFSRLESLTLGDVAVRNAPVQVMPVRQYSQAVFGGRRVDGIIGTVFLYHFLATLDYPGGRLILRRPTAENVRRLEEEAKNAGAVSQPFWMSGDHYMVAWGAVNQSRPMLFFVDTGLAGGGFTCPESTLKEAGIKLMESAASEGLGGGGKVRVVPFVVEQLSFGEALKKNVRGLFTGGFPVEEALGFHIGGLISHGFFRPFALTFDFTRMRLYLKRSL